MHCRTLRARLFLLLLPVLVPACGGAVEPSQGGPAPAPGDPVHFPEPGPAAGLPPRATDVTLCDGSPGLRLVVQGFTLGGVSPKLASAGEFIAVDGACRYWVSLPSGSIGTGQLSESDARQLTRDMQLQYWAAWKGTWLEAGFDGYGVDCRLGEINLEVSVANANASSKPASYTVEPWGMQARQRDWIAKLGPASQVVAGPARVLAVAQSSAASGDVKPWPLADAIEHYASAAAPLGSASGTLVSESDAAKLRAIKDATSLEGVLMRGTSGDVYSVYWRSALPFETADGRGFAR